MATDLDVHPCCCCCYCLFCSGKMAPNVYGKTKRTSYFVFSLRIRSNSSHKVPLQWHPLSRAEKKYALISSICISLIIHHLLPFFPSSPLSSIVRQLSPSLFHFFLFVWPHWPRGIIIIITTTTCAVLCWLPQIDCSLPMQCRCSAGCDLWSGCLQWQRRQ